MVIDLGGREIPWYAAVPIGARNYTQQERPAVLSAQDIQNYIEYEQKSDAKMREGSGWLNDTLGSLSPIKIAAMVAATVSGNPELIPVIAGADTAIQGGSPEDVLKSAAIAAATQGVGSEISSAIGSGTDVLTADDLYTGQAMTDLANSGGISGAYTTPVDNPVYSDFYDAKPLTDPYTGQPFGSIQDPLVDNYMDGFTSTSETGLATLPDEGMMPDLPGTTILGDLGLAGAVETPIPSSSISISQALRGLNLAKGLLGGGQKGAAQALTRTPLQNAQASQQQSNMANILRGTQMPQTMTPSIYNQKNPFNFGQQASPVQDTNALVKLLRTA